MIPELISLGLPTPWAVLPEGVHETSFEEVARVFTYNEHRRSLFAGFVTAAKELAQAGCGTIYLDGSFVTGKPTPGDFDACWDTSNVDSKLLRPEFLDFSGKREAQKRIFRGELFPVSPALGDSTFLNFFQIEKVSGRKKGLLKLKMQRDDH